MGYRMVTYKDRVELTFTGDQPRAPVWVDLPVFMNSRVTASAGTVDTVEDRVVLDPAVRQVTIRLDGSSIGTRRSVAQAASPLSLKQRDGRLWVNLPGSNSWTIRLVSLSGATITYIRTSAARLCIPLAPLAAGTYGFLADGPAGSIQYRLIVEGPQRRQSGRRLCHHAGWAAGGTGFTLRKRDSGWEPAFPGTWSRRLLADNMAVRGDTGFPGQA